MILFFSKLTLIFSSITLLFSLSACGQKGPLYIQENSEMPSVEYVFDKEKKSNESTATSKEPSDDNINNVKP